MTPPGRTDTLIGSTGVIQGVSNSGQVGLVALTAVRYAQADAPGIIVPVRRAQMIYAQFAHIQVQPDSRLQDGVPLYKLQILDTLIDQMSRATGATRAGAGHPAPSSIDATITGLSNELRSAGGPTAGYRAAFLPPPGAFVDLVA